jgi:two-component system phosphate regulon sensor histidine kinase PhoR
LRSLSFRCLLAFVAIIVITTLSAGVPAYITVRTELAKQAWAHVADGGRVTMALLETEKDRLANLAILVAQRPTLQNLVQQRNIGALNTYLQTFQATVGLDILVLSDTSGLVIANGTGSFPSVGNPFLNEAVFQVLDDVRPQLALLVSRPVPVGLEDELYITVGTLLDNGYARKLAVETGFEHSFLVDEQRVSTTLSDATSACAPADAIRRAIASGATETARLDFQDFHYYVALIPLPDADDQIVGLSEVCLPVENLLAANQNALLVLVLSTLLVAIAASGLASYFARRLTAPLKDLTEAAIKISQGDLNSPVPVPESPSEISTLAIAFEKSRETTLLALEDLSRAKVWFETLIQSVVEGIVTVDNQGIVTSFNQGAERITGWSSYEILGKSINQAFPLVESDGDFMQHIPRSDGVQQVNVKTCAGQEVTLAVTGASFHSPKSGVGQMVLVLRDISEEEAARRLRSYFLANISHEFRTPLTALNASVELLLEDIEELSLAEIAELLNSIHLSVTGLQTLIDNLLESTSIEAGRFRIRCQPTDLGDVVTDALQVMKPLLERRKQNLSLAIPARMPLVSVDPTRLTQVLVNLLSNASKFSPMESIIELRLKIANERTLRISISDQGPGIPLPDRSKLYHRFTRLGETERAQYGIGLGLSVVKAIIEAHHGEVGMEERPGGGSIFWFTIPLEEAN